MIRVILDTNVLINGVQDENSFAFRIISLCLEGELQPISNRLILKEYQFLSDQLMTDEDYLHALDDYYEVCEDAPILGRSSSRRIEDDPEDEKFLDAAESGRANFIISDDHHLLDLEKYGSTKILTPREFWAYYQANLAEGSEEWGQFTKDIGL